MRRTERKSKNVRNLGRVTIMLCLFVIALLFTLEKNTITSQAGRRVVRVGYIDYAGFIESANGNFYGYGVDYLEKISEYTGWEYEYVYDSWPNCLKKLKAGEIDLLCTAQYTPERAKEYLYSSIPLGYESTILYVSEDSDIYYEDYEAMDGCRVGLLTDSFQTKQFLHFAREKRLDVEENYYDTESKIMLALSVGSIDMAAVGGLSYHKQAKAVGRFGAEAFYCITGKGNAELMEELDGALQQIKVDVPSLETELTQKYYSDSAVSSKPLFTKEEHEYIQQAEPIKIKLMGGKAPISYEKDKKPEGIIVDYLNLISEKSGLRFDVEMSITSDNAEEELNQMTDDYLVVRAKQAIEYDGMDERLLSSMTMLGTELSYVRRQADFYQQGKLCTKFALTTDMKYLEEPLYEYCDHAKIFYYSTVEECMDSVVSGLSDVAIQNSYIITYMMQKPQYMEELVESPGGRMKNGLCLVGTKENQILIDIFNKTIHYISAEEVSEVITTETLMNPYQHSVADILYKYRYTLMVVFGCLILAAVGYTLVLHRMTNLKIEKKEYEILQKQVQEDELTGVYNRKTFFEKAGSLIHESSENMCIVIMDIVNFKVVNDLYGMEVGDKLLQYFAGELRELSQKKPMLVARFTGDHFYICMKHDDFQELSFRRKFKTFLEEMEIAVTYGVFEVGDRKNVPVNIMCDRASLAAHDKNRSPIEYVRYYSEEERKKIIQEQEIENEMERALEKRQFCVFVQPKYDVFTGEIVGGEALVRWKHPRKGMIPPVSFIGLFERNGFILRLDYYVWEETCKLLAELKKEGLDFPISINVSRAHFYGKDLLDKLTELVSRYQLDPDKLELEITENICAEDQEIVYQKISQLQKAGFKVAMDDFGSGYSSLNMLKEIPLDIIKMDLKFLDGGDDVKKSQNILQKLVELAHSLELLVVVEGVETAEQVAFLQDIGNHYVQGYYYSQPVECKTYVEMLQKLKKILVEKQK